MHAPTLALTPGRAAPAAGELVHHREPLVDAAPGAVTAAVVLATRPGPSLATGDRRRLALALRGLRRRLRHRADPAAAGAIGDRLRELADAARDLPVGDGIALLASADDARLLHLRLPVRTRVLVGPAPTLVTIAEAAGGGGRLAVLAIGPDRARLLVAGNDTVRDVLAGFPIVRAVVDGADQFLPDYLASIDDAVVAALPEGLPLVVAGDERLAAAFVDRSPSAARGAVVLPGDHRWSSPLAVLAVARRHLRRSLTVPQRRALADVAVALADGRLAAGPEGVAWAAGRTRAATIVVERGHRAAHPDAVASAADAVHRTGGRLVVVPDGRLADLGRIVLVHDHRPSDREVAS